MNTRVMILFRRIASSTLERNQDLHPGTIALHHPGGIIKVTIFSRACMTIKTCGISLLLLILSFSVHAHPDGATPFWYPSSYIFGFIRGCAETVEQNTAQIIEELWPDEIRSVCGCVVDSLRHSFTYHEALSEGNAAMELIVSATLPICIEEELARKNAD
jgi:hypothetical protein